jgi:hypothetical protein
MPIMNSTSGVKKPDQRPSSMVEVGFKAESAANNPSNNKNNSVKISNSEDAEEQEVDIEDLGEDDKTCNTENNQNEESADDDQDEEENDDDEEEEGEYGENNSDISNDQHSRDSSGKNIEASFPVTFSRKSKFNFNLNESMLYQDVLQVSCNFFVAELHKKKFGSGGKGHCIKYVTDSNEGGAKPAESSDTAQRSGTATAGKKRVEKWFTPIEFEIFCGKGNCRDWKRTIKVGGQPLLALLEARILICHAVSCACGICNRNETLVGPIRPFMKYRRRNRDEILAQNAYKKFLSLKPPTLLHDTLSKFSSSIANNSNNNNNNSNSSSSSSNGSLLASTSITNSPVVVATGGNNNSNVTATNVGPSILNIPISNLSGGGLQSLTNFNFNNLVCASPAEDLVTMVQRMQENEDKKWSSLEQVRVLLLNCIFLYSTLTEFFFR